MLGVSWSSFFSTGNHSEGEQGTGTKCPTVSRLITDGEDGRCETSLLYLKLLWSSGLTWSEEAVQASALGSKLVGTGFNYQQSFPVPSSGIGAAENLPLYKRVQLTALAVCALEVGHEYIC